MAGRIVAGGSRGSSRNHRAWDMSGLAFHLWSSSCLPPHPSPTPMHSTSPSSTENTLGLRPTDEA